VPGGEPRATAGEERGEATVVTAAGIIEGELDVLAALCERRGQGVLEYCRHVGGPESSAQACSEAFARFRRDVAAATDPEALDPDEALLRATRYAAAEHAVRSVPEHPRCSAVPRAIAARACGEISSRGGRRLAAHLRSCVACREAEACALAAERAYREPSMKRLPPAAAEAVLIALEGALPGAASWQTTRVADAPSSDGLVSARARDEPFRGQDRDSRVATPVASDITRSMICDGDPGALAALCERRGVAVFTYCVHVTRSGDAAIAAAEVFAAFRAAIAAPGDLTAIDAETLLRSITRRTAGLRAVDATGPDGEDMAPRNGCAGRDIDLVQLVSGLLAGEERRAVDAHVAACSACKVVLGRLEAAESAFDRSSGTALTLRLAEELLGALIAAAPVRAHGGDRVSVFEAAMSLLAGDGAAPQPPRRRT